MATTENWGGIQRHPTYYYECLQQINEALYIVLLRNLYNSRYQIA